MRLKKVLARCGILKPRKEAVEALLRYLAESLASGNARSLDTLRRKLPVMSTVHGFLVDIVPLVSSCLHSQNRDMVIAGLQTIDVIVGKHGSKLGVFSVARLLSDVVLFPKGDKELYDMAMELFCKLIDVKQAYTFYALARLMAVSNERVQLQIILLLLEYFLKTRKLDRVLASQGCRIAMEGLLYPSSALRLAAFDLVHTLHLRGTPNEVLLKFFEKKRAPEKLLLALRVLLSRRHNPLLTSTSAVEDVQSDAVINWAQDTATVTDFDVGVKYIVDRDNPLCYVRPVGYETPQ